MLERALPSHMRPLILTVEDDADIQQMLEDLLSRADYQPILVGSGEAALRYVADHSVDLMLLDLRLPGIDGFEVCRQLREVDGSQLPVIMLTANQQEQGVVQGLNYGADDYLTKPFVPAELLARVSRLLQRGEQRRALVDENEGLHRMLQLTQHDLGVAQTVSSNEGLLRRELLHNVTTHLQALCGVIESEFRRTPPGASREVVQRILGRVRGAALVYEVSEALQNDPVRVDVLIETIASAVKSIYSPRKRLPVTLGGGPVELPLVYASPLAMVINELVTNCFKHAFPNQRFGKITIEYTLAPTGFRLQIADDGVGMVAQAPVGRGRITVTELVQNLGGSVTWQSDDAGTSVAVQVPVAVPSA
ncbi:MAG: response regulator [Herpetosiphonaceae bacterium]|nr:response regulator [Herpetosiphonaceae bacterium]